MSGDPIALVEAFLAEWPKGKAALRQSFVDYLAPDLLYENVGLTRTISLDDALALIEGFAPGLDNIGVEMLAIAGDGNRVLTERIDILRRADGSEIASIRVMGIFELRDDRIAGWRDYFDTAPFAGS